MKNIEFHKFLHSSF